jgi:hypothetical protein
MMYQMQTKIPSPPPFHLTHLCPMSIPDNTQHIPSQMMEPFLAAVSIHFHSFKLWEMEWDKMRLNSKLSSQKEKI